MRHSMVRLRSPQVPCPYGGDGGDRKRWGKLQPALHPSASLRTSSFDQAQGKLSLRARAPKGAAGVVAAKAATPYPGIRRRGYTGTACRAPTETGETFRPSKDGGVNPPLRRCRAESPPLHKARQDGGVNPPLRGTALSLCADGVIVLRPPAESTEGVDILNRSAGLPLSWNQSVAAAGADSFFRTATRRQR